MKQIKTALGATFTVAGLLLISTLGSCKKGDKGDTGAAGINGTNGNANVHASFLTIPSNAWTYLSSNWEYYVNFTDNDITQDVVDYGTVSVFLSGNGWESLPYTNYYNSSTSYSFGYNYKLNEGSIFILISNTTTFTFPSYNFKIVAISGAQRKAHPYTNWKDYNSIKAALGSELKETSITSIKKQI